MLVASSTEGFMDKQCSQIPSAPRLGLVLVHEHLVEMPTPLEAVVQRIGMIKLWVSCKGNFCVADEDRRSFLQKELSNKIYKGF